MRLTTARAPVVVVALLAAACGAGGRSATTATGRGGAQSPGAASSGAAAARSTVPAASPATSTPVRSGGAAARTSSSAPGATRSRARTGGTSPLPTPGTYTYGVSGTATSPLGTKDLSGSTDLTVGPVRSARQRSVDRAPNGTTDQTVVARPGGIYLADLHISQQGFDEDFRASSPVLVIPADPRRGASWSWRVVSTDGSYTMRTTVSVANPDDTATVSGRRLRTVAVTSHSVITGSRMQMTIDLRDEVARGLPVLWEHSVVDGTAYGARFHADSTRRLRSTTPR